MANLRGLAIVARDRNRLADFYQQVFELKPVSRNNSETVLSDGRFNLALRKSNGGPLPGLYAAGFQVDDTEPLLGRAQRADPDGNRIEVSELNVLPAPQPGPFPIRHIASTRLIQNAWRTFIRGLSTCAR